MRKVMLALVLCLSVAVVAQGGIPITVENASFEEPFLEVANSKIKGFDGEYLEYPDVPDWEDDCLPDAFNHSGIKQGSTTVLTGQRVRTGNQAAHLSPDSGVPAEHIVWQLTDQTIIAGEMYGLDVWAWSDGTYDQGTGGIGTDLKVSLFYDDGGEHIEVAFQEHFVPFDIDNQYPPAQNCRVEFTVNDVPASIGSKLGIKFENITASGFIHLDDARLERVLVSNPDPYDGETGVLVTTNLGWELESIVTNCDVYFGTDPNMAYNPMVVDGTEGKVESYDLPVMDNDTTYYWRVDARVGTEVYEGDVWKFTTEPIILEDPCGLTVNASETAVLRVKATAGSTYLWKRLDESTIPDNTGATLTITNVQKVNEDVYYCEVTNSASVPVMAESARVNLMTKRLVALWEFEDNLEDSEADGRWDGDYVDPNGANPDPTAVYGSGLDGGQALQLTDDPCYVLILDSEDFFNFYPQGYTVNAWVKTEMASTASGYIASKYYDDPCSDVYGWLLNCNDKAISTLHTLQQADVAESVGSIIDNQWHMVTGTYDAETGVVAVYVDGILETESEPDTSVAPINLGPVIFGAIEAVNGEDAYEGLLDKASIYSYALGQVGVAALYADITGESVCLEQIENDFSGNCRVDLEDFAMFATGWLECNLVPQTECP
jgi:Concanavalin A-like lectin/glucanases superfamily